MSRAWLRGQRRNAGNISSGWLAAAWSMTFLRSSGVKDGL